MIPGAWPTIAPQRHPLSGRACDRGRPAAGADAVAGVAGDQRCPGERMSTASIRPAPAALLRKPDAGPTNNRSAPHDAFPDHLRGGMRIAIR